MIAIASRIPPTIAIRRALLIVLAAAGAAHADPRWHLTVESDVFAYPAQGYSMHAAVRAPDAHVRFGFSAFGSGARTFPGFFEDILHAVNRDADADRGWHVGSHAWAIEGFYDFWPGRSSPYVGVYLIDLRWFGDADDGSHFTEHQLGLLPAVGYRWYPGRAPVFLAAWGGFGVDSPAFAKHERGARHYDDATFYPFASIHLGLEL